MSKKLTPAFVLILALCASLAAAAPSDAGSAAQALARFEALAGTWQGKDGEGNAVTTSYEVVADGATVLERYSNAAHGDKPMLTVYHLDGDRLVLTHYCMAGNQPRMEARTISGDQVGFEMFDVTNLASSEAGHMHKASFHFVDADHFTTAWTFRENGQDAFTEEFHFERAR